MNIVMLSQDKSLQPQRAATERHLSDRLNQAQHFVCLPYLVHFVLKVSVILVIDHLSESDLLSSSLQDKPTERSIEQGTRAE